MHGITSLRFLDYSQIPRKNDFEESNQEEEQEPYQDKVHIELINETIDKIIYPKELGINLDKKELLELEDQIKESEYLYYDQEQNIRVGIIKEDLEDNNSDNSDFNYAKDLMDDSNTYRTFDETLFDKIVKHETLVYRGGFPPR